MSSHIIASLAEASRRGKVFEFAKTGKPYPKCFGRDWHYPSFDFGKLLLGDRDGYVDWSAHPHTLDNFAEAGAAGTLNLPFPECMYIFQTGRKDLQVLHVTQSSNVITGESYVWTNISSVGMTWCHAPVRFSINLLSCECIANWTSSSFLPWDVNDKLCRVSESFHIMVAVGTMILLDHNHEREVQPSDEGLRATNNGRAKVSLAPIPEVITIRLNKRSPARLARQMINTDSVPRRPHNRRAHYRHLRSGKVIPVRASAIHGGGDPRHFQIIP